MFAGKRRGRPGVRAAIASQTAFGSDSSPSCAIPRRRWHDRMTEPEVIYGIVARCTRCRQHVGVWDRRRPAPPGHVGSEVEAPECQAL